METVEVVKVQVELAKPMVEAMENFIASNTGYNDQTFQGFVEYLIRMSWGDLHAKLGDRIDDLADEREAMRSEFVAMAERFRHKHNLSIPETRRALREILDVSI